MKKLYKVLMDNFYSHSDSKILFSNLLDIKNLFLEWLLGNDKSCLTVVLKF